MRINNLIFLVLQSVKNIKAVYVPREISALAAFKPTISRNLTANFCLRQNWANSNISRNFGSVGFILQKNMSMKCNCGLL